MTINNTSDAGTCTDGWTYSPHSGNCYKVFSEHVMWTQAEINCVFAGGHQASVHSRENNQFLTGNQPCPILIDQHLYLNTELASHEQDIVWLGLALFGNRREYEWADQSAIDYTSWENGKPTDIHNTSLSVSFQATNHHSDPVLNVPNCKKTVIGCKAVARFYRDIFAKRQEIK
jgi:hypothetical protein